MKTEYQIMNDLMDQSCFSLDRRENCRRKNLGENLSRCKEMEIMQNYLELEGVEERGVEKMWWCWMRRDEK